MFDFFDLQADIFYKVLVVQPNSITHLFETSLVRT